MSSPSSVFTTDRFSPTWRGTLILILRLLFTSEILFELNEIEYQILGLGLICAVIKPVGQGLSRSRRVVIDVNVVVTPAGYRSLYTCTVGGKD